MGRARGHESLSGTAPAPERNEVMRMTGRDVTALVLTVAVFVLFLVNAVWGLLVAAVLAPLALHTRKAPAPGQDGAPAIERIDEPDREPTGSA